MAKLRRNPEWADWWAKVDAAAVQAPTLKWREPMATDLKALIVRKSKEIHEDYQSSFHWNEGTSWGSAERVLLTCVRAALEEAERIVESESYDQTTHYAGCERTHRLCAAFKRIRALRESLDD